MTRRGALALLSGDRGLAMLILSFVDPAQSRFLGGIIAQKRASTLPLLLLMCWTAGGRTV